MVWVDSTQIVNIYCTSMLHLINSTTDGGAKQYESSLFDSPSIEAGVSFEQQGLLVYLTV